VNRKKGEAVSNTRFIHAHFVEQSKGRATIAWKQVPEQPNKVLMGVAWCSPKDHFRRDRGRVIAEGRLNKKPLFAEVVLTERKGRLFVSEQSVLAAVFWTQTCADVPRWAKNDALLVPSRAAHD